MGLFDWVMKGIGFESDEDGYINQNGEDDIEPKIVRPKHQKRSLFRKKKKFDYDDENVLNSSSGSSFDPDQYNTKRFGSDDSETEQFGAGLSNSMGGYGTKNFVFYKPKSYDDVKNLVEYLRQSEPAIIDLSEITAEEAQRILDFVSGSICALNGGIQRIVGNIFLLAPEGFNITMPENNSQN